jgi:farnesyl diphosphate synthase
MTLKYDISLHDISLPELSDLCSKRLKQVYSSYLPDIPSLELRAAISDALMNEGKHLRPMLIYATGAIFNAPLASLDLPASAVEMIHTYSLIHDDLPCMDNADLRRGKPTSHKVHGYGMAVLTGDALNTLALQILAHHPAPLLAQTRINMISTLCIACGPYGLAAGQALDITASDTNQLSTQLLEEIYRLKTGVLFSACIELGRLAAEDTDEFNQTALQTFGDLIGFAFQIQDDILDVEIPSDQLGKTQGIDSKNNKVTYVTLHGVTEAKLKVESLYEEALQAIDYLGSKAKLLREIAAFMLRRKK